MVGSEVPIKAKSIGIIILWKNLLCLPSEGNTRYAREISIHSGSKD